MVGQMQAIEQLHGRQPGRIQVDNGSEFISKALDRWAYENRVVLDFSRPGKPTDYPPGGVAVPRTSLQDLVESMDN